MPPLSPPLFPQSLPSSITGAAIAKTAGPEAKLMAKARELEASFLAEMLGHAGLGKMPDNFGGGIGEEQFASFLRAEQAKAIVAKGGIGLAQHIFESLQQKVQNDR